MPQKTTKSTTRNPWNRTALLPPVVAVQTAIGDDTDANMDGAGPSVPKKLEYLGPRLSLDDLETEMKREVAASAGLTGTA
jgi:hypothetical protein